ncbi:GDH/6PGL endoplasmic bifunctional protein [Ambystoma mexicanum]|uniref:GDH/6PGL endoplasmic bifunctional protein n=1 Tax=Ambystoma mexicanum TaxID=8296 RepID=UPI0037E7849C
MMLRTLSPLLLLHMLLAVPGSSPASQGHVTVVLMGATGDLAKKYLWQGLFQLYLDQVTSGYTFSFHGAALTEPAAGEARMFEVLKALICEPDVPANRCALLKDQFLRLTRYWQLKTAENYTAMIREIERSLKDEGLLEAGRLFYLSVPPFAYADIARHINTTCRPPTGAWLRVVLEKPFGHDLESAQILATELQTFFQEEEMYRVDHYLGKQTVAQILPFRHLNHELLDPLWNRRHVERVEIVLKETVDAKGRTSFYEEYGVVRDVIQNHLTEMLMYVALEMPQDPSSSDEVLQRKLQTFGSLQTPNKGSTVIGQYQAYAGQVREELQKPEEYFSTTPTFAGVLVHVNNLRWEGVPFILTSGKALDEREAYVRILFKHQAFCTQRESVNSQCKPRQIIFHIGHGDLGYPAILVSRSLFKPSLPDHWQEVTDHPPLLHVFGQAPGDFYVFRPLQERDAYSILIGNIFQGEKQFFITTENLLASWEFWTPLLDSLAHEVPRLYPGGAENGNALDFTILDSEASFVQDDPVKLIEAGTRGHTARDFGSFQSVFRGSPLVSGWTDELISGLAREIQETAEKFVTRTGTFHLAVSGGSSPVALLERLATHHYTFPWKHTHLWLVDERCVPLTDPESNFRTLHDHLLQHVRVPYVNIHPMPVHVNQRLCVEEDRGADLYARDISKLVNNGSFDMVLLGVGTDGHTASLFPHSGEALESDRMVLLTESPSKPHQRMSFSLSLLNKARRVAVLVLGTGKHDIVTLISRVAHEPRKLPITGVSPSIGQLVWYIDYDALLLL